MELDEFHISEDGSGARGEHDPLSEIAGGIGGGLIQSAEATGRKNDICGRQNKAALLPGADETGYGPAFCQQPAHLRTFQDCDGRRVENGGCKSPHNGRARAITFGMQDAPAAMSGFQPENEPALCIAIETNSGSFQGIDDGGGSGDDICCHSRVTEAVACGERIAKMQCSAVVSAKACGNAALRPGAGRFATERAAGQKQDRLRCERQCCHQAGNTAADDDRPARILRQSVTHTASILSTARRAATATAGSIVTSWRFSSSAVRILPSVMRFMCGQRLQGRMNSTSG